MSKCHRLVAFVVCLTVGSISTLTSALPGYAQGAPITGTVVSSSRNTVTVTTAEGQYQLFVFARNVRKPNSLPAGSRVRVVSSATGDPGVRSATEITLVQGGNAEPG